MLQVLSDLLRSIWLKIQASPEMYVKTEEES